MKGTVELRAVGSSPEDESDDLLSGGLNGEKRAAFDRLEQEMANMLAEM